MNNNKHTKARFLMTLNILFITLKVTNYIDWNWFLIFSPIIFPFFLFSVAIGIMAIVDRKRCEEHIDKLNQTFETETNNIVDGMNFVETLAIIFIGLKLTNNLNWSWGMVLLPLSIEFLLNRIKITIKHLQM